MKVKFYVDVYTGINYKQAALFATTQPCQKGSGSTRFAFEVTLDDAIINQVDVNVPQAKVGPVLVQP
jgi:hypothetical protein